MRCGPQVPWVPLPGSRFSCLCKLHVYTSSLWYTPWNGRSFTCTLFANVYTGVALFLRPLNEIPVTRRSLPYSLWALTDCSCWLGWVPWLVRLWGTQNIRSLHLEISSFTIRVYVGPPLGRGLCSLRVSVTLKSGLSWGKRLVAASLRPSPPKRSKECYARHPARASFPPAQPVETRACRGVRRLQQPTHPPRHR